MPVIISILIFLFVLTFLVIIHELGHFIVARLFHITIEEFGIGYPPKVCTLFRFKGIPFTLNAIPVGGFVRMQGEDESSVANTSKKVSSRVEGPFYEKSKVARLFVILAGASVNFLFGILAFTIIFSKVGIPTINSHPTIVEVSPSSPAQEASLMPNDEVLMLQFGNEQKTTVSTTQDVISWIGSHQGDVVHIQVKRRDGIHLLQAKIRTATQIPPNQGALGVVLDQNVKYVFYPWYQMPLRAAVVGTQQSLDFSKMILTTLGSIGHDIVTKRQVPQGVAGPIGIAHEVTKQKLFSQGWLAVLNFTALLSINLAVMNVLPIPVLDGGRAFFIILEIFIGKKRRASIEGRINQYGMAALLLFILLISINDVIGIFKK